MNLIIDANIIFSGILNTNGKIADLLINSGGHLRFIAPDYLRKEIKDHYPKLVAISKLSLQQIQEAEFQIYKIWSGDKKLIKGLLKKDFDYFLDTDAVYALRESLVKSLG